MMFTRQQNMSPVDQQMDQACRDDRRALTACLEEEGGVDTEGKCVPLQRRHALCVASFKCPPASLPSTLFLGQTGGSLSADQLSEQVKDKLFACMQKAGQSPLNEGYLARMREVKDFKERQKAGDLKACLAEEVDLDSCLTDVAIKQWESYGIPTDEYQRVSQREKARLKEESVE
jgi:hypothetical protein